MSVSVTVERQAGSLKERYIMYLSCEVGRPIIYANDLLSTKPFGRLSVLSCEIESF